MPKISLNSTSSFATSQLRIIHLSILSNFEKTPSKNKSSLIRYFHIQDLNIPQTDRLTHDIQLKNNAPIQSQETAEITDIYYEPKFNTKLPTANPTTPTNPHLKTPSFTSFLSLNTSSDPDPPRYDCTSIRFQGNPESLSLFNFTPSVSIPEGFYPRATVFPFMLSSIREFEVRPSNADPQVSILSI